MNQTQNNNNIIDQRFSSRFRSPLECCFGSPTFRPLFGSHPTFRSLHFAPYFSRPTFRSLLFAPYRFYTYFSLPKIYTYFSLPPFLQSFSWFSSKNKIRFGKFRSKLGYVVKILNRRERKVGVKLEGAKSRCKIDRERKVGSEK